MKGDVNPQEGQDSHAFRLAAFIFLAGYYGYIQPEAVGTWLDKVYSLDVVRWFGWANVWLAVALTLVRGVPVLVDAVPYMRHGGKTEIAEPLAAPVAGRASTPEG